MSQHSSHKQTAARDAWATPPQIAQHWIERFFLEVDVCASAANHKCPSYFTAEDDGLAQEWTRRAWCNPPYSEIMPWVEKALASPSWTVLLLPARTDAKWFHRITESDRVSWYLSRGRVRFVPAEGVKESSPNIGNAIFVVCGVGIKGRGYCGGFDPKTGRPLADQC